MRSRGPFNPGPVALLLVAAVALPELLKQCKPLAKSVGDFLVKVGEEVQKMAGTEAPEETPNEGVSEVNAEKGTHYDDESTESTKEGAATAEVALDTVSPTGHEEIASQIAAEAKGDTEAPARSETKPKKSRKAASEIAQPNNPKERTPETPEPL